ncbi:MAG: glycosyltransferase family 4 protein [Candidatus Aenigmatarchaeota archaeon]
MKRRKLKILVTHELFMPDFAGGGEKIVYEYTKRLAGRGHDVTVLTTGDPKVKNYENIKTVRIPIPRYSFNLAVPWILKYAKDADIIQTNNYNAALPSFIAGKILHKPVVCIVHGVYGKRWKEMRGKIIGSLSAFMEKSQLRRGYDRVVFYSAFAREQGYEIGIKHGEVFYLGIDPREFKPKKKEKYVLFVGRLEKQKGIENLIKVAKDLPDIKFKIVGKGDIEKLKKTASKNVQFLGVKTGKELQNLFSHALVFCLPSVAETFGLVLLEAMASGCAIVSTVPLDYRGVKVQYGDNESLKHAIRNLMDNPKLAERLGKENVKIAKKYDWEVFVDSLEKLYYKLVK